MEHILFAYGLDSSGKKRILRDDEIDLEIQSDGLAWVHLDYNSPKIYDYLTTQIKSLDTLVVNALLANETRPRVSEINNGLLVILRGINFREGSHQSDMISARMWIDNHRIISVQKRRLQAIYDIEDKIENNLAPKTSGQFLAQFIKSIVQRITPVMQELAVKVDQFEEMLLRNPHHEMRNKIILTRRQIISLKRHFLPQYQVLNELLYSTVDWLDTGDKRILHEQQDIMTRFLEDLDLYREKLLVIHDDLTHIVESQLNKNLYTLSIISSIFMPLSFLTGLLGINVTGIPGASQPNAFLWVCGILAIVASFQLYVLKKAKIII